jgi:uncharacterized protein
MWTLVPLFFITGLVYSMAGFGGGSTYLALLVLFDVPHDSVRSIALICNLAVVSFGAWQFARAGHLRLDKVLPFLLTSIPMAYWGGTLNISKFAFTLLLGISLAVAASRMLWMGKSVEPQTAIRRHIIWTVGLPLGALLGFLAGVVGIGGGIYLAPVLLLLGWADAKQTAAAASFFILVNSLAGLAGQASKGFSFDSSFVIQLLIAAALGGQIGSRLGALSLPKIAVQRVSGLLILLVSCRLLWSLI